VPTAAYDDIADWYHNEFLSEPANADVADRDPIGTDRALRDLLGTGRGICLEVGCGTGVHATRTGALGWTPIGVDISAGMLRYARGRLPIAQGNALRLPIRDDSVPAVIAMMVHTDMPAYPDVLHEIARVLQPGGVFVHVGVHPCFCGGFADRTDPAATVIRPGYRDGHWTKESWTTAGVRNKVGASHWPLSSLLGAFLDAGLEFEQFAEGGEPTPITLSIKTRKPQ